MIVTVKIAPPERWCPGALHDLQKRPEMLSFVGMNIRIESSSMRVNWSEGQENAFREWRVIDEDLYILEELADVRYYDQINHICEHVLEMD
jgi:hypothetical protein